MKDNIPDALIAAFELYYAIDWNYPALRNERLAWRAAWAAAMGAKQCLHQIAEPSSSGKPNNCPTVNQQLTVAVQAAAPVLPEPSAYRLRNTAFRSEVYEYFRTKYLAECRQKQFNSSVDDGGLYDLTPIFTEQQVRAMLAAPPTRKQIEQYLYEQGCYVVPNGVPASAAMAKKKARAAQNWDPTFEEIRALAKKSGMSEYGAAQDKFLVVYRETLLACPADLKAFAVEVIAAVNPAEGVPAIFGDEDHVLVPRGLIGAACSAIDKKRDGTKTLAELRRYTTGDLSAATQPAAQGVTEAARSVLSERARQISVEGYKPEQDDGYNPGVLALHGGLYACHAYDNLTKKRAPEGWQWDAKWWKPKDPRTNLVKAGALILAEIERMDRSFAAQAKQGGV